MIVRLALPPLLHLLRQTHQFLRGVRLPAVQGLQARLLPFTGGLPASLFSVLLPGVAFFNFMAHRGILEVAGGGGVDGGLALVVCQKSLPVPQFLKFPHDLCRRAIPKFVVLQLRRLRLVLRQEFGNLPPSVLFTVALLAFHILPSSLCTL